MKTLIKTRHEPHKQPRMLILKIFTWNDWIVIVCVSYWVILLKSIMTTNNNIQV